MRPNVVQLIPHRVRRVIKYISTTSIDPDFESIYFLLAYFSVAEHAVRQRQHPRAYLKLHVTRSLLVRSSQLQYRIAQSGQGARGDRCRSSCGMLRSYEAAVGSPLETFVPYKLDILPEDVRYWTLLDIR